MTMSEAARQSREGDISQILQALVAADGTASHDYSLALRGPPPMRSLPDLSDMVHYLCMLHGRHPGVIDHAATRTADNAARGWLVQAGDAFGAERAFLTQVTVAVGPLPSTAGQSECEIAVVQQRHALDMLAQSDRRGCAMGAAIALVLDWQAVRKLIDIAALRADIEPTPCLLPGQAETLAMADALGNDEPTARALQFGARQLLRQHRGLWDLLHARTAVRSKN